MSSAQRGVSPYHVSSAKRPWRPPTEWVSSTHAIHPPSLPARPTCWWPVMSWARISSHFWIYLPPTGDNSSANINPGTTSLSLLLLVPRITGTEPKRGKWSAMYADSPSTWMDKANWTQGQRHLRGHCSPRQTTSHPRTQSTQDQAERRHQNLGNGRRNQVI